MAILGMGSFMSSLLQEVLPTLPLFLPLMAGLPPYISLTASRSLSRRGPLFSLMFFISRIKQTKVVKRMAIVVLLNEKYGNKLWL